MPPKTRVYWFDEEKSLKQGPATQGARIWDVPRDLTGRGGGWRCVAVSDSLKTTAAKFFRTMSVHAHRSGHCRHREHLGAGCCDGIILCQADDN